MRSKSLSKPALISGVCLVRITKVLKCSLGYQIFENVSSRKKLVFILSISWGYEVHQSLVAGPFRGRHWKSINVHLLIAFDEDSVSFELQHVQSKILHSFFPYNLREQGLSVLHDSITGGLVLWAHRSGMTTFSTPCSSTCLHVRLRVAFPGPHVEEH